MEPLTLEKLFEILAEKQGSDLHLQAGSAPSIRLKGELIRLTEFEKLNPKLLKDIIYATLSENDIAQFEKDGNLDTAVSLQNIGRFRVNIFLQRGTIALVGRRIATTIPDFTTLNLPPSIEKITTFTDGLVLVTGPTGSGKSSTLAAIVNHLNKLRKAHILSIEDPIEYLYRNDQAIINQREVGIDVKTFNDALRYAVRQDPDIILIGEMRDKETVEFALQAAETGHLVFGTLHSSSVANTIGRILNFFPEEMHLQVRKNLAAHIRTIISQMLLPSSKEAIPVVPICEILFRTPTVIRLILEGGDAKLLKALKAGKSEGMQDFEQALIQRVHEGFITEETAFRYADNPHSLEMKLKGIYLNEEEGGLIG